MARKPKLYTRLTRSTAALASYKSLWLGSDHLLVVHSTGYTEEYRRIRLRDIQGFFTTPSERRNSWSLVWLFLGICSGIVAGASWSMGSRPIWSVVLLVIAAIGCLWNFLLGPSCKVYVVTSVQTVQLPSIVRRGKAKKVLARIELLIAAAQADLIAPGGPVAEVIAEPPPLA